MSVAYATAAGLFPALYLMPAPVAPADYIFHIGMAGGRAHYTLETTAHRDGYKIKDVNERDGWSVGEHMWKREGLPARLKVGWDEADVLRRWRTEVEARNRAEPKDEIRGEHGKMEVRAGDKPATEKDKDKEKGAVVALSNDAGRFLCEFALMCALVARWREVREAEKGGDAEALERAKAREGKVAFLHVPGGVGAEDVARGVMVAEAAIRSLVSSCEEGRRRKEGETLGLGLDVEKGRWEGVVWKS